MAQVNIGPGLTETCQALLMALPAKGVPMTVRERDAANRLKRIAKARLFLEAAVSHTSPPPRDMRSAPGQAILLLFGASRKAGPSKTKHDRPTMVKISFSSTPAFALEGVFPRHLGRPDCTLQRASLSKKLDARTKWTDHRRHAGGYRRTLGQTRGNLGLKNVHRVA